MSTMYPVLRGIPIPPIDHRPKSPRGESWPLDKMRVNDMIFVPQRDSKPVSAQVSRSAKWLKARFVTRTVTMRADGATWLPCKPTDPDATTGVGIWRVK